MFTILGRLDVHVHAMSFTKVLDIHVHVIHSWGMTKLDQWMKSQPMRDAALAELVGCERSMITKLRHGKATPSLPLALAINRETGVELPDLMPVAQDSAA